MKYLNYIIFTIIIVSACKKKDKTEPFDVESPYIYLTQPYNDFIYPQEGQIPITGNITDNFALRQVRVDVKDTTGNPVFAIYLGEERFSPQSRVAHHGSHTIVDVSSVYIDTLFKAPVYRGKLTLSVYAEDQEGNNKEETRTINIF